MPVTGPFDKLHGIIEKLRGIEKGNLAKELEVRLKKAALQEVETGWSQRVSPQGKPWRSARDGQTRTLVKSGKMRGELRAEDRVNGFAITVRANAKSGALYGGTQQYGRTIKAKGMKTRSYKIFEPSGRVFSIKMRGVYDRSGAKPMKWQTPDGKWHSAYKFRVPARPVVPPKNELPAKWDEAFRAASEDLLEQQLK